MDWPTNNLDLICLENIWLWLDKQIMKDSPQILEIIDNYDIREHHIS